MSVDTDALIVGAGPAGASAAIRLANAGWQVTLLEQRRYPRRKVCGECIAAGSWMLLDELGVGAELQQLAGPELRQVGWMSAEQNLRAPMPPCTKGLYPYGRALGRNHLDTILLERARSLGVAVLQPAKLLSVSGTMGDFQCQYELRLPGIEGASDPRLQKTIGASLVIDAHGSWEGELVHCGAEQAYARPPLRPDWQLLAFKADFRNTKLPGGYLPVIAFAGGYGGMVIADDGRATLACCIRRDALERCRRVAPGETAGTAIEAHLRQSCRGIAEALGDAQRDGNWISVGPIRPGVRVARTNCLFRIGNAAGETHPLIGEGISMALESASLLVAHLGRKPTVAQGQAHFDRIRRAYAMQWRRELTTHLAISKLYAHIAMNPTLASAAQRIITRLPGILTVAARLAGKARPAFLRLSTKSGAV